MSIGKLGAWVQLPVITLPKPRKYIISTSIKTHLKTVNAKHVSVMAYHDLSIKCSNSAALSRPKKTLLISLPKSMTSTKACKYITAMLKRKQKLPVKQVKPGFTNYQPQPKHSLALS